MESEREEADRDEYLIGELADEFGLTLRAMRFYEDKGLLKPRRNGTQRIYSSEDRRILSLIAQGRRVQLPLHEVRQLLKHYDPANDEWSAAGKAIDILEDQEKLLEQERTNIDQSMNELDEMKANLRKKMGNH